MEQRDQEDVPSVAGDEVSPGIRLGGSGGRPVGEEPDVDSEPTPDGGLDSVVEQGRRLAWGRHDD